MREGSDLTPPTDRLSMRLRTVAALGRLMRCEGIERVRTVDLCREAGIARSTFYEAFPNVYGVASWAWDYLMNDTLYQSGITLSCYDAHLAKFRALRGERQFFADAFRLAGYESITQHGGRTMLSHYEMVFRRKTGRAYSDDELLRMRFFNDGATYMTRDWVEGGMVESPEAMAGLFTSNMPAFMVELLDPAQARQAQDRILTKPKQAPYLQGY